MAKIGYSIQGLVAKVKDTVAIKANVQGTPEGGNNSWIDYFQRVIICNLIVSRGIMWLNCLQQGNKSMTWINYCFQRGNNLCLDYFQRGNIYGLIVSRGVTFMA